MLDDFTPIIHHLPGRTTRIYPIADVHIGAKEADIEGFGKFIEKIADDDSAMVCIAGDLINNGLRSANCPTDIYSETLSPSGQIDLAVDMLQPIADKILGVVGGNHERRTNKQVDLDPMYEICARLRRNDEDRTSLTNIYRPNMAFMRIILKNETNSSDRYSIMMTHGKSANKKKNFTAIVEGVDACIYAHTHTPDISFPTRIRFNSANRVSFHNVISITCCSWLKPGGYSLSELYVPQVTSRPQCLELEFVGSNRRKGEIRLAW